MTFATTIAAAIARFVRHVAHQRSLNETARLLSNLDDKTLRDIGLWRGGIHDALNIKNR